MNQKTLMLLFVGLSVSGLFAQPMKVDQKSIALNVNPVFSYVGNLFSDRGTNNLSLNGAGAIYRKVYKENRALRLSTFINFYQFANQYQGNAYYGYAQSSATNTELNGNISIGKEYFKLSESKKNSVWRWYGGWTFDVAGSYNNIKFSYHQIPGLTQSSFTGSRVTEKEYERRINGGFTGFLGAEYYLNNRFFIGVEARASLFAGYQFNDITRVQAYFYDQTLEQTIGEKPQKVESGAGIEYGFNTGLPVIFTAGFVF